MPDPYLGEIRLFGGNFEPAGWMICDGRLLPISEFDALFALIGTTYGGDGQETFAIPNLLGRVPVHQGSTYPLGQAAGVEEVTLTTQQIPIHTHALLASTRVATQSSPAANMLGQSGVADMYGIGVPTSALAPGAVSPTGGSQPHQNMQPYLGLNFILSVYGHFPSPT